MLPSHFLAPHFLCPSWHQEDFLHHVVNRQTWIHFCPEPRPCGTLGHGNDPEGPPAGHVVTGWERDHRPLSHQDLCRHSTQPQDKVWGDDQGRFLGGVVQAETCRLSGSEQLLGAEQAFLTACGCGLCKGQELSEDRAALGRVQSRMVSWDKTSLSLECQGEVLASLSPTP